MDAIKQILSSKTIWFSIILSVIGILQANSAILTANLTPTQVGYFTTVMGLIAAGLRAVTSTPLVEK